MADSTDYEGIAEQILEYYYSTFDEDRSKLEPLYRQTSIFSFSGTGVKATGTTAIIEALKDLPFQKLVRNRQHIDVHPLHPFRQDNSDILVLVCGTLKMDDAPPNCFSHMLSLVKEGGTYFIEHDVLQFIYTSTE
ncbi:Nuclear transport factor 2 [Orbilia ellipsospora]|uniref:NTF2-related export protein n=1 Tax=Orbilia ellipsospora TaxID=2528407 RepID=A0AAV9XAU4_9PEZI